jgi:hypothetical protein
LNGLNFGFLNFGNKAITATRESFDVARIVGRIAEGLTQFVHRSVQAMAEVHKGILRPDSFSQFFPGHELAGVFEKRGENFEWLAA